LLFFFSYGRVRTASNRAIQTGGVVQDSPNTSPVVRATVSSGLRIFNQNQT
jgi:hypothetical protein